jgi:hypothetical protein
MPVALAFEVLQADNDPCNIMVYEISRGAPVHCHWRCIALLLATRLLAEYVTAAQPVALAWPNICEVLQAGLDVQHHMMYT